MSKLLSRPMAVFDFQSMSGDRGDMGRWEPSLARQEFAEECDINTIMLRYEEAGAVTHVNQAEPIYMDVTAMPDLRGAMDAMREASVAFYSLPAKVRREFDNDPQAFVDFAQDPKNLDKMREWELAPPAPAPAPAVAVQLDPASLEALKANSNVKAPGAA